MKTRRDKVQWKGTRASWDDIVALYHGLETVAFWQPDNSLDVETDGGRESVPVGSWISRRPDGTIESSWTTRSRPSR